MADVRLSLGAIAWDVPKSDLCIPPNKPGYLILTAFLKQMQHRRRTMLSGLLLVACMLQMELSHLRKSPVGSALAGGSI